MKNFLICAALLTGFVCFSGYASADVNMQEGQWETTIEMKMEGMPFPMPPITSKVSQCLTKKDMVPDTANKDQKCEVRNRKVSGNKVSWTVICSDKDGRSEGEGEITYSGSTYKGVIKTKIFSKGSAKPMISTMKLAGKRTGNCTNK